MSNQTVEDALLTFAFADLRYIKLWGLMDYAKEYKPVRPAGRKRALKVLGIEE